MTTILCENWQYITNELNIFKIKIYYYYGVNE